MPAELFQGPCGEKCVHHLFTKHRSMPVYRARTSIYRCRHINTNKHVPILLTRERDKSMHYGNRRTTGIFSLTRASIICYFLTSIFFPDRDGTEGGAPWIIWHTPQAMQLCGPMAHHAWSLTVLSPTASLCPFSPAFKQKTTLRKGMPWVTCSPTTAFCL
jgi:hypothetical protein